MGRSFERDRARLPSGAGLRFLIGIAGLAFSLTLLWLSMRAVLDIGGACATGGPYVPAVECPAAVAAATPLSIVGLFAFGGLAAWGAASLPAGWLGLILLAWPALFLSLGWNFLEYGIWPPGASPGEVGWGWLVSGVAFVVMGGGPLALGLWGASDTATGGRAFARGRVVVGPRRGGSVREDGATRQEHLARLHLAGELTDREFEAARRATIDEPGP